MEWEGDEAENYGRRFGRESRTRREEASSPSAQRRDERRDDSQNTRLILSRTCSARHKAGAVVLPDCRLSLPTRWRVLCSDFCVLKRKRNYTRGRAV